MNAKVKSGFSEPCCFAGSSGTPPYVPISAASVFADVHWGSTNAILMAGYNVVLLHETYRFCTGVISMADVLNRMKVHSADNYSPLIQ